MMSTDRRLNVAMLGTKFMGRAHAHAWRTAGRFFDLPAEPGLRIVAGRDAEATRAFADRWGWEEATTRWRTAVAHPEVDLVDVATPNDRPRRAGHRRPRGRQARGLREALGGNARGCPGDARRGPAGQGRNLRLVQLPAGPRRGAGPQTRPGRLGRRIYHVRAAYLQGWGGPETPLLWRFRRGVAGSGAQGDLNAHIVDMARFVTGEEIVEVSGAIVETFIKERRCPMTRAGRGGAPSTTPCCSWPASPDGAVASFESTRLATGVKNANRIEIHGEHGALRFDFERMNELQVFPAEPAAPPGVAHIM